MDSNPGLLPPMSCGALPGRGLSCGAMAPPAGGGGAAALGESPGKRPPLIEEGEAC